MAKFNPTVITNSGLSLISRLLSGSGQIKFTRICTSKSSYSIEEAQNLENLTTIEQSADVSKVEIVDNTSVKVSATITNELLEVGYYINAIGLYAEDPDFGEILYSITIAQVPDWMQPDSGSGISSLLVQLITQVSNASIVQIEVNPSVLATMKDINDLQESLSANITSVQNAAEAAQTTADNAATAAAEAKNAAQAVDPNNFAPADHTHTTVNGFTVETAVPADAKFTDTTYSAATTSVAGLVSTEAQTLAGDKTFEGQVIPAGASDVTVAQARKIYAGTEDMTAGTSSLETGAIYLVYE